MTAISKAKRDIEGNLIEVAGEVIGVVDGAYSGDAFHCIAGHTEPEVFVTFVGPITIVVGAAASAINTQYAFAVLIEIENGTIGQILTAAAYRSLSKNLIHNFFVETSSAR